MDTPPEWIAAGWATEIKAGAVPSKAAAPRKKTS